MALIDGGMKGWGGTPPSAAGQRAERRKCIACIGRDDKALDSFSPARSLRSLSSRSVSNFRCLLNREHVLDDGFVKWFASLLTTLVPPNILR